MSNTYNQYINFLEKITSQTFKKNVESSIILPIFDKLKQLYLIYKDVLTKFKTCNDEFGYYIEKMEYEEDDINFFYKKFHDLKEIDAMLFELKTKPKPSSIENEIQSFIDNTYSNLSINSIDLEEIKEKIYTYHNKITDTIRYESNQKKNSNSSLTLFIIIIVIIFILILIFN